MTLLFLSLKQIRLVVNRIRPEGRHLLSLCSRVRSFTDKMSDMRRRALVLIDSLTQDSRRE